MRCEEIRETRFDLGRTLASVVVHLRNVPCPQSGRRPMTIPAGILAHPK